MLQMIWAKWEAESKRPVLMEMSASVLLLRVTGGGSGWRLSSAVWGSSLGCCALSSVVVLTSCQFLHTIQFEEVDEEEEEHEEEEEEEQEQEEQEQEEEEEDDDDDDDDGDGDGDDDDDDDDDHIGLWRNTKVPKGRPKNKKKRKKKRRWLWLKDFLLQFYTRFTLRFFWLVSEWVGGCEKGWMGRWLDV